MINMKMGIALLLGIIAVTTIGIWFVTGLRSQCSNKQPFNPTIRSVKR